MKRVLYVNGRKERKGIVGMMGGVRMKGSMGELSWKVRVRKGIWDGKGKRGKGRRKEGNEVKFGVDKMKGEMGKD